LEEIIQVHDSEEENYREARRVLGKSISLVQDLIDLYELLAKMIEESGIKPRDEIVSASQFLLACRYQLTLGVLSLLRGHLTDSFYFTRKAIELCAFAARIKNHPHLAMVWLCAGDDDTSYKKFREKFSPGKLFPEDHAILGKLCDQYDLCSKHSHPSIFSLARNIATERTNTEFNIKFGYFQLKAEDPSEPIRTLLWVVNTHFGILQVFTEVLADVISHDRPKWEFRRNAVNEKFAIYKKKWKSVLCRERS
jgi:hypothetical protein